MYRFYGRIAAMEQFKSLLPFAPGAILFLIESGLQVSGISNIWLAVTLWGLAAILLLWATWHSGALSAIRSRWIIQWPIRKRASSATQLPALPAGLYVSDIRLTFASLAERHSEISMRVFNGTSRVVEFSGLSGRIKFTSPNSADPSRTGELPTPSIRADMAQTVEPFKEWLVILSQRVPAPEADKLLAMLAADIPIHFDLHGLTVEVCAQDDQQKVERLPIWGGVSYNHGSGFGQIIYATANTREASNHF
jgi:hypothetical protein